MEFLVILSIYRMIQRSWIITYRLNNIYPYNPFTICGVAVFHHVLSIHLRMKAKCRYLFLRFAFLSSTFRKVESQVLAIVP